MPGTTASYTLHMDRPIRFEENRWLGDKRNQRVHDLDHCDDQAIIDDLIESQQYASFGPDTFVEASNRGYKPCTCPGAVKNRFESAV